MRSEICGFVVALACIHGVCACNRGEGSPVGTSEYEMIDVTVLGSSAPFEGASELSLRITNKGAIPRELSGLKGDRCAVEGDRGQFGPIHPFSVGVDKPVKVPARGERTVSLLFKSPQGHLRAFACLGKLLPVP